MATGTLKDNGDQFERAHHEWIAQHLPGYETVWQRFIGNDGNNRPFPIKGLTPDEEQAHKLFYQSHYSLAFYAHLFEMHAEEAIRLVKESTAEKTQKKIETHLRDMKNFTLFVALLGQACDMVEAIGTALKDRPILTAIAGVFSLRNNSIHAARIPIAADADGPLIAPVARMGSEANAWKKGATWDSVFRSDFKYLDDWLRDTRNEFFEILRTRVYPRMGEAANRRFGREVVWPSKHLFGTLSMTAAVSASDAPRLPESDPRFDKKPRNDIWVPPSGDGRSS